MMTPEDMANEFWDVSEGIEDGSIDKDQAYQRLKKIGSLQRKLDHIGFWRVCKAVHLESHKRYGEYPVNLD